MTITLPTAMPADPQLYRFARRMDGLKASAIRELLKLTERPEVISFAGGLPAPELFPVSGFAEACAGVLHLDGPAALQYSTTEGFAPLRTWVCEHLYRHNRIETTPDRVLIVSGSQQGLDLVGKVLLDPGDLVVIENPAYMGAIQAFQAYEAAFLDVATDGSGMIPDALREALAGSPRKPKLIYLVSNFANPTGITTTLERRKELVAIAREHAIPIFEDDPYGRLRYSGEDIASLAALAEGQGVFYAGTASKTMVPGMRVAWLVIPDAKMYEKVVMVKQAADLHTSTFAQRAVHAFAARPGAVEAHVANMIPVYRKRRDAMLEALAERMPAGWNWTRPEGGLFIWVRAPEDVDTTVLLERALERNVAFVPGTPFWVNRDVRNTLRLNFSNAPEARIREGVQRLAQAAVSLV
jgi:2-aminoadipate transaminase